MILPFIIFLHGAVLAYLLLSGKPSEMAPMMRSALALLALAPVLVYWLWPKRSKAAKACSRQPCGWLDRLSIGAVFLTLGSGFFWLLNAAPEPLENLSLTLEQTFRPQAASLRQATAAGKAAPQDGNWLWNEHRRRPLPKRTNFKPGNRPEVFLKLQDSGDAADLLRSQIYVRAFALSRYDHAAWSAYPGTLETLKADAAGLVQLGNRSGRAIVHEVFHSHAANGQNVLTALQGVTAAQVPELTRLDEGLWLLPPPLKSSGYEYVASSVPLRLEDLPEGREIAAWPQSPAVLTALPEAGNFTRRIRELASVASGTGTTPQRLLNLRNHLRTTLNYSLESSNPNDLDPIENFLFAEQRGHCEYFATAGALLARALGVPARVAYGWAGGTYYESTATFVFRAREAHAWTEVCLAGYGWVILDATPPTAIRSDRTRVARPEEKPPGADANPTDDPVTIAAVSASPARVGWWLTCLLMIPAVGLLVWRGVMHRRAAEGAPNARETALRTPHYLSAWRRAAARRGMPMPAGMTLRRHLAQLREPLPFATELLAYHYGTRYCGAKPNLKVEQQLNAAIRKWEQFDHQEP